MLSSITLGQKSPSKYGIPVTLFTPFVMQCWKMSCGKSGRKRITGREGQVRLKICLYTETRIPRYSESGYKFVFAYHPTYLHQAYCSAFMLVMFGESAVIFIYHLWVLYLVILVYHVLPLQLSVSVHVWLSRSFSNYITPLYISQCFHL